MTLEQLSERTHVSPNYLGRVEMEKADPSLSVALAIARALRTPIAELVSEASPDASVARKVARSGRTDAREIGTLVENLPLDVQETLLPLLRVVAARSSRRHRAPR